MDREAGLKALMAARAEEVRLAAAGKTTQVTFRLVVSVEESGKRTNVLDSVFNHDGELVEVRTADAHLRELVERKVGKLGDVDSCYKRCSHHLDNGNAPKYAVCFYACLAAP